MFLMLAPPLTHQKVPQGTPQKAPPVRRAPHPANTPLPTAPPQTQPTNPFKEGTKKFLVAQRLIAGEVDRGRVAREVGVSSQTIYNVVSDLRIHGYTLSIDVNSPKSHSYSPTPRSTSTPPATQESTQGEIEGRSVGETTPQSNSSGEVQSRSKFYPGETTQVDESPPGRSSRSPRSVPREPGITREDVIEIVGEAMKQVVEEISPEVKPVKEVPQDVQIPLEDVQLAGEKVNYRIALNPEIFFRYNVFKASIISFFAREFRPSLPS